MLIQEDQCKVQYAWFSRMCKTNENKAALIIRSVLQNCLDDTSSQDKPPIKTLRSLETVALALTRPSRPQDIQRLRLLLPENSLLGPQMVLAFF